MFLDAVTKLVHFLNSVLCTDVVTKCLSYLKARAGQAEDHYSFSLFRYF